MALRRITDAALPMNTGAEAVETAIKAARRWAYQTKAIPQNRAEITVVRLAPPLVISSNDLDWALDRLIEVIEGCA